MASWGFDKDECDIDAHVDGQNWDLGIGDDMCIDLGGICICTGTVTLKQFQCVKKNAWHGGKIVFHVGPERDFDQALAVVGLGSIYRNHHNFGSHNNGWALNGVTTDINSPLGAKITVDTTVHDARLNRFSYLVVLVENDTPVGAGSDGYLLETEADQKYLTQDEASARFLSKDADKVDDPEELYHHNDKEYYRKRQLRYHCDDTISKSHILHTFKVLTKVNKWNQSSNPDTDLKQKIGSNLSPLINKLNQKSVSFHPHPDDVDVSPEIKELFDKVWDELEKTGKLAAPLLPPEIQKQLDQLQTRRDGRVHWKNLKDDGCDLQAGTSGGVLETGDIIVWDKESNSFSNRALDDAVKQQVIVTGSIPYDANGSYDTTNGLSKDVSSAIPTNTGFTLVAVTATGYKAHQVTGDREEALPLILEPKVDGNHIRTRVWDAAGIEYGGATWTTKTAHIDYTLFISR